MKTPHSLPKWASPVFFVLLFFSGMAGLIYEIVWFRVLDFSFGTTQTAVATVLAAYMVGMGFGSIVAGKYVDRIRRPMLVYAILEAVIGIYAIFITPIFYRAGYIYTVLGTDPSPAASVFFRIVPSFLFFLVPTSAMGASLPVLSKILVKKNRAGAGAGKMYAANTVGAVAGCILAGFVTIRWLGLDGSLYMAMGISLLTAATAFIIHSVLSYKAKSSEKAKSPAGNYSDNSLSDTLTQHEISFDAGISLSLFAALMAALMGGAASLGNEVVWNRVLGMVLDGTVYGFAALLAAFLTGIALGSAVFSLIVEKHPNRVWDLLIAVHVLAGVGAIITMLFIPLIPGLAGKIFEDGITPYLGFLTKSLLVFFAILVPTFFYGAAFPITVKLASMKLGASKGLARVYAFNMTGAVIGVLAAGLVLPSISGTVGQMGLLNISLSFVTATAVAWVFFIHKRTSAKTEPERKLAPWIFRFATPAILLVGLITLSPDFRIIHIMESRYAIEDYQKQLNYKTPDIISKNTKNRVVFKAEGKQTIVTIRKEGERGYRLRNNGLNEAYHSFSEPHYASVIFFLGTLPYMLHPNPRTALLIGLGSGGTAESMIKTELKRLDVIELEPEVVRASQFIYRQIKGNLDTHPLRDRRSSLIIDDARNTLLKWKRSGNPRAYDIVVSQPSHPWLAGMSYLYTLEHFSLVNDNLAHDGLFCQWINLFRMNERSIKSVLSAFVKVFKGVHVFRTNSNSLLLIGSKTSFAIDPGIISYRLAEDKLSRQASLFAIDMEDILLSYLMNESALRKLVASTPPNTDRNPTVEMDLPWIGHDTVLLIDDFLKKESVDTGIRPAVLKENTSTFQLWSRLAKAVVEKAERGGEKTEKAKNFLNKWGHIIGLEKKLLLGRLAEYEGDEEQALGYYDPLFKKGDLQAAWRMGCLLQRQGKNHEAIRVLKTAVEGAWEIESRICLARSLLDLSLPETARSYLEPILDIELENYVETPHRLALLYLAEVERAAGNVEYALELTSKHLELMPSSNRGHYLMSELFTLLGKTKESRKHARKAAGFDRDRADALEIKGRRAAKNGHISTAERYFSQATHINPWADSPYEWMAIAYRENGHYNALNNLLKEASTKGVSSSIWREELDRTSTLAQTLGLVIAKEVTRVRKIISLKKK